MRHIKTINELNTETYLSAARKLSNIGHNHRSKMIMDYVDMPVGSDKQRIHYHKFYVLGSYYEVYNMTFDVNQVECFINNKNGSLKISVNTWNNNITISIYEFEDEDIENEDEECEVCCIEENFLFSSRKDAIEFKKLILDEMPDFIKSKEAAIRGKESIRRVEAYKNCLKVIKQTSINKFYL